MCYLCVCLIFSSHPPAQWEAMLTCTARDLEYKRESDSQNNRLPEAALQRSF